MAAGEHARCKEIQISDLIICERCGIAWGCRGPSPDCPIETVKRRAINVLSVAGSLAIGILALAAAVVIR